MSADAFLDMTDNPIDYTSVAATRLRAAWNQLIMQLQEARDGIDHPELYPPPTTSRNLAEGYRYVLGFLYGSLSRCLGPAEEFPYFVRVIQPLNRSTIDNADAIYFVAPIDGNHFHTIHDKTGDTRHWQGDPAIEHGPKNANAFAAFFPSSSRHPPISQAWKCLAGRMVAKSCCS